MRVNGKIIYRSAADGLYRVQGESGTYETKKQAEWFCLTEQLLTKTEVCRLMAIQEQKIAKAQTVQMWATRMAGLDGFLDVVNARGFGYGQANEPTTGDLAELGITQDDYRNGITLLLALRKFIEGTATLSETADRRSVLARLRTDV